MIFKSRRVDEITERVCVDEMRTKNWNHRRSNIQSSGKWGRTIKDLGEGEINEVRPPTRILELMVHRLLVHSSQSPSLVSWITSQIELLVLRSLTQGWVCSHQLWNSQFHANLHPSKQSDNIMTQHSRACTVVPILYFFQSNDLLSKETKMQFASFFR